MKSGKGGRGDIKGAVRPTGESVSGKKGKRGSVQRDGKKRRAREIDCPRLCPRPVVCLHQSSAKRADRTEEAGEARRRRRRRV